MKQNIFIAALLAGMLVLAGCGGGSSATPEEETETMTETETETETPTATAKSAKVPGSELVDGGDSGIKSTFAAGDVKVLNGLWYQCTGGSCAIEVNAGERVSQVSYTGTGTLTITANDPRPPTPATGGTSDPVADSSPLSNANLLTAVLPNTGDARNTQVWGAEIAPNNGVITNPLQFNLVDGSRHRLWINAIDNTANSENYLYYGHWASTAPRMPGQTSGTTTRDVVWGGSMPYNAVPDKSLGTATYNGDALTYSKEGAGSWTADAARSVIRLTADFETGDVRGRVEYATGEGVNDVESMTVDPLDIVLNPAIITAGKFSGTARFGGSAPNGSVTATQSSRTRGNGSWEMQFFGPTTNPPVTAGDLQTHEEPSHAAGEFTVTRGSATAAQVPGSAAQPSLTVHGTFGATHDDSG